MSASITARPKAVTLHVLERTRGWLNPLNLHWAGIAVLGLVNLYLLLHMAVAWQQAKSQNAEALARQQVALKTAQIAERPLEGLDVKLQGASGNADRFYRERLPVSYSEVATELGVLAHRDHVRLTRGSYAENAVTGDAAGHLTEVRMDYSLSGDYRALVLYLNGLERDKVFFLISGVSLTGQQSGTVNLRVKLTTYLRGLDAAEGRGVGTASLGQAADGSGSLGPAAGAAGGAGLGLAGSFGPATVAGSGAAGSSGPAGGAR